MAYFKRGELEYLMGLQKALYLVNSGPNGLKLLEMEVKARLGGMSLPANVDKCILTELARKQIRLELEALSVATAWGLERGLKLPPSRIGSFLTCFNDRIDIYRYDPEQMRIDARILDQSWGGADLAGKKFFEMYEERLINEKEKAANE